ncbi:MAG: hypothetical protein H6835_04300 [Planctomycetes bacterium]|nr:hypothetical protein [Planctomycetota bacterium]
MKVTEIWKLVDGFWIQVWELGDTGGYSLDGQATQTTDIKRADGSNFSKDERYRIVIEAADSDGNSTSIKSVDQKPQ